MELREVSDLYRFNEWANARLFEVLPALDVEEWSRAIGGSFGSLQGTVAHVVGVEWLWLERLRGRSPRAIPSWVAAPTVDRLSDVLRRVEEERRTWLATLSPSDLDREIGYRFVDGTEATNRLAVLLRHVVDHSSYHRGQCATILRLLGRVPPTTGLVYWDLQSTSR